MKTEDYVRQEDNKGALLNTDIEGLKAYKRQKQMFSKFNSHEDRLSRVESSLDDIKSMLTKLLENGNDR